MKRVVLLLLTAAAVGVVVLSLAGGIDLAGPARLLVVAGGVIIAMASVDELVQGAKAVEPEPAGKPEEAVKPQDLKPQDVTREDTIAVSESAQPPMAPKAPEPALVLSSSDTVIDLRDQPSTLVDELIADGQLTRSREPISDLEIPAIVMAAFAHQLSLQAA